MTDDAIRSQLTPAIVRAIGGLLAHPGFAAALDQLVADMHAEHLQPFVEAHREALTRHVPPDLLDGPEIAISILLGWMLGYPAALATPERRGDIALKHLEVASFAAGLCGGIVGKAVQRRSV